MVVGITGGVGSGKSTILKILEQEYGAHLIMADDVARELMEPGNESYNLVVKEFGQEILEPGGRIDRAELAKIVFSDEKKLEKLNSMTHPQTKCEIKKRIEKWKAEDENCLIILETAILLEAGFGDLIDELWVVVCSYEKRLERLEASRGYSKEKTDSIIRNQKSNEELEEIADFVIDNSGTVDDARCQIAEKLN